MIRINEQEPAVACLFDLDGVLIDSETEYTRFWERVGMRYRPDVPDLAMRIKGTTLENILDTYFPTELHPGIIQAIDEQERNMDYDIKPGVTDLLTLLMERGIPAVMVTSSNNQKMSRLWEQHPQFRDWFSNIVTADMISRSKPDPEGYLLGAGMAGVPIRRCCVFEDSRQGVMAGRNAGAYVVGIAGTLPAAAIAPYSDRVIDTLEGFDVDELVSILRSR